MKNILKCLIRKTTILKKKLENIQPTIENNTIDNNTGKQTVSPDSDIRKDNGNKNNDTEQSNQEKIFKLK